jgi:hypothetical protein
VTGAPSEIRIEAFISRSQGCECGQERANYGMFLAELRAAIGVPAPDPAAATTSEDDYVLERAAKLRGADGAASNGRIDLYKCGCFVLEAKQSREMRGKAKFVETHEWQMSLLPNTPTRGRRGAGRGWDMPPSGSYFHILTKGGSPWRGKALQMVILTYLLVLFRGQGYFKIYDLLGF